MRPQSGPNTPSNLPSRTYRLLREAVLAHKQITCIYDGRSREACPHILGYKDRGQEAVLVFQFAGESTGRLPEWRCFDVARVTDVQQRDGKWYGGTRHSRAQSCIKFVDVDANVPATLKQRNPLAFGSPKLRPPRSPGQSE